MIRIFSVHILLITLFYGSYTVSLPACNGDFKNHCYGIINHRNGERYVGEIRDFKYNGQGTYLFLNGNIYEGEFKDGIQDGYGSFKFSNGDKYEGGFKNGLFPG